jgi:co-chaperonin GroES (HSP10)
MNTFSAPECTMRVVGNRILVRVEDAPKLSPGGILFVNPASATPHAVGTVLAIGHLTGPKAPDKTPIPGLRPGDRILFLRALEITDSNPQLQRKLEDHIVAIRPADVLLLLDEKDVSGIR